MATGFVQRYKGKIDFAAGGLWIAGVQIGAAGADLNVNTGWGTVDVIAANGTIPNSGLNLITSTALASGIYNLAAPVPGHTVVISASTASTAWMIKTSTGVVTIQGTQGAGSLGGSSLTNTIKSTSSLVATQIEMIGLSTSAWLFNGVYPSTLAHLLFSTTT